MSGSRSAIRTPDQRLRVFVSSTLKELAPERKTVRQAIERLAAAPVMFELGARPHPPRELYRAYLEQSDIFLGLYWEKYGWVAPGEDVSGLEDEYNLVPPEMPRLVYIKETTGSREARLVELLDRVRSDDRTSFKYFSTAEELGDLVVADLAVLLAERFDLSRTPAPLPPQRTAGALDPGPSDAASLPKPLTRLFGREDDVEGAVARLRDPQVRLLTLTGPGGIGKTRLAIETARRVADEFRDGATFVPLAAVDDPERVPEAIAQALGIRETGGLPVDRAVSLALARRNLLLVLDNFEQVLDAAPLLPGLLESADGVKVLVTSRALLRVAGEQSLDLDPLELPEGPGRGWPPPTPLPASVALLVDRARAVKPDFELTPQNLPAVEGIALRLEGIPLALELAAARLRVLSPQTLLERLDHRLELLVGGRRDLPSRQQAVRSTIEWSTNLLGSAERDLLWRLGVFAGPFSLESAEAIAEEPATVLPLLELLVDASLVRQREGRGGSLFVLLATVQEYALEQLTAAGLLEETRLRHANCFLALALQSGRDLLGARQADRAVLLAEQRDNLRAAARHLIDLKRWDDVAEFTWVLLPYWWIDGLLPEARGWMRELLASGGSMSERSRAVGLCIANAVFFWREPSAQVLGELAESAETLERGGYPAEAGTSLISLGIAYAAVPAPDLRRALTTLEHAVQLARRSGNTWGESLALTTYGAVVLGQQDTERAIELLEQALRLAEEQQDYILRTMANNNLAWAELAGGDLRRAALRFDDVLHTSLQVRHDQGVAAGLEGLAGIAALNGDALQAGILTGAAEALRERVGVSDRSSAAPTLIEKVRSVGDVGAFDEGVRRGSRMPVPDVVAVAEEVTALVETPTP